MRARAQPYALPARSHRNVERLNRLVPSWLEIDAIGDKTYRFGFQSVYLMFYSALKLLVKHFNETINQGIQLSSIIWWMVVDFILVKAQELAATLANVWAQL